ncbi:MAG: tetratricopeptide repeat protein [Polyangiaceae bacterium]
MGKRFLFGGSSLWVLGSVVAVAGCGEPARNTTPTAGTATSTQVATANTAQTVAPTTTQSAASAPPTAEPAPLPRPRGLARKDGSAADESLLKGDAAYESGDFAVAEDAYRKAMQLAPKDPAPIVGLARSRLAKENVPVDFNSAPKDATLAAMIKELARAVKLDDRYAPAHLELGRALLVQGKAKEALASIDRALELDGSDPEAHSARGVGLLASGDIDGATKELARAAELDPNSAARQSNVGTALLASGRVDEAIAAYRRALALAPNDPGTLNDLGTALLAQAKPDEAIPFLEKAGELQPKSGILRQNLAYAHHLKGEFDKAESLYREALALDDTLISAWVNLGNLLAQRGKLADARAAYEHAAKVDATDPRVQTAFAELDEIEKKNKKK